MYRIHIAISPAPRDIFQYCSASWNLTFAPYESKKYIIFVQHCAILISILYSILYNNLNIISLESWCLQVDDSDGGSNPP